MTKSKRLFPMCRSWPLLCLALSLSLPTGAMALDHLVVKRDGQNVHVSGKVLVEAVDGGLLLCAPDGVYWAVPPEELVEHKKDDQPFAYLDKEAIGRSVLAEMPPGYKIYTTANYVICYNTSRAYAQWCGALFERLYRGFGNYWEHRGLKLHDLEQPMVALVFDDQQSYARYAKPELGEATGSIIGYYSLRTNRVTMYDLTGIETLRHPGDRRTTTAQINDILRRPEAERTVATIIHEATHQLAFNCGLQERYADIPLWVSEGIAVYFETPDLSNSKGWGTIGSVNQVRLTQFYQYLKTRPAQSLVSLMADDQRFRDPKQALDAYAEAWLLNYFLLRTYPEKYAQYLQLLSKKSPLLTDGPQRRLEDFRSVFGSDMEKLDAELLRQLR